MRMLWTTCALSLGLAVSAAGAEFDDPVMLKAGGKTITLDAPGHAAPCLADIDGDGTKDLLVGQFASGRIKIYKGLGNGRFADGKWLKADGKIAEVPGVW